MNAYMNFIDDATLYAILQALSSFCADLKEEILHKIVCNIMDEQLDFSPFMYHDVSDGEPINMWEGLYDDDNYWDNE